MPAFLYRGRLAFHETDAAGIAHFSNFLRLCEEAETHAMASVGFLPDASRLYPRVHVEADFSHPLRFWEAYAIRALLARLGNSSLHWQFTVEGEKGVCAQVRMVVARRNAAQGAEPFTEEERQRLSSLMESPCEEDA